MARNQDGDGWIAQLNRKRQQWQAQRRKERAADPRTQAIKRMLQARRREAYEQAKERRKQLIKQLKLQRHERDVEERAARRAELQRRSSISSRRD
jgi:hypothetical protein